MSRVQLDSLYARRLVYIDKYNKESRKMHNIGAVDLSSVAPAAATTSHHHGGTETRTKLSRRERGFRPSTPVYYYEDQKDSPLKQRRCGQNDHHHHHDVVGQESDVNNVFLDAGETLLPECATFGAGQEQEEEENDDQGQQIMFVKLSDLAEAQAAIATELVSADPLSSSSATSHSSESQAMPNSRTATTVKSDSEFSPTQPPASATTFAHKLMQEIKEESCDEDGYVSLTSCAIVIVSLGLRAIRHLIRSYQKLSMESESLSPFSRETMLSPHKPDIAHNKASTQIDSTLSAEQFDFYDTEETHQHPENATIDAAAAAEDAAKVVAAAEDTTIAAAAEDAAEETTVADSMTELEETCRTTPTDPEVQLMEQQSHESSEKAFLQGRNAYSRTHSMLTVHTPDHRGFLGLPKNSLGANAQGGVKQVEPLVGPKLSHMSTSKPNNNIHGYKPPPHSRMSSKSQEEIITQGAAAGAAGAAGASSTHSNHFLPSWTTTRAAPAATTTTSKQVPIAKQIAREAVLARVLVPPPSPLPPSESWFAATTSFRKPLGSFIREKHAGLIRKSASHQDQVPVTHPSNSSSSSNNNNNNNSATNNNNNNSQRICSSKDLLQRRQSFRPTIHAI